MPLLSILVTCVLASAATDGAALTEQQQADLPLYFGFDAMEIYKIKPGISDLRLDDLNGDGRVDVLLWNGYQSRFEMLYQPGPRVPADGRLPELEQNEIPSRGDLQRADVPVNYKVAAVDVGEFTGDEHADIVFFGEPKEIVILPGKPDGGFGAPDGIRAPEGNPRGGSLCVGDFNHDGRDDVALLGTELLLIYHQKEAGGLAQPQRLVHGIKSPMIMLRVDLNGDGRDDLTISSDDDRHGLYVALQSADGALAALRPVKVPRMRSLTIAPASSGAGDDIYCIEYATNRLKQYHWAVPAQAGITDDWPQRLHSYPIKSKSKERRIALGDLDGDGLTDCVALDSEAAQMILFKGTERGLGPGIAFPGLVQATDLHMTDVDRDGRSELLIASAEERMIGRSHYEDGRLTFPEPLVTRDKPYVVTSGGLRVGAPVDHIAYVTGNDDDEYTLVIRATNQEETSYKIEDLEDEPRGIRFVDVNQDDRTDLLVFISYNAPITYLQDESGAFERFSGSATRESLLKEAKPHELTLTDVTGDGRPELLFAQENMVRALIVRDKTWTVVDQYNPETADARITGVAALPDRPGSPLIVIYERKSDELLVFQRDADGAAYRVVHSMPVGSFDLSAMLTLPVGRDSAHAVLLADDKKLAVLMPHEQTATLVEQRSYSSDTKDAWLADSVVGDLNHDGVRDVVVVDMAKAALEVLTTTPTGFAKALRFQVFQGKRFADAPETYGEPRNVLIADVTGDNVDDIVLTVHDRVIVYPGQ